MKNLTLFRIECIAATKDNRPCYIRRTKVLRRDNDYIVASSKKFEETATKILQGAGLDVFFHYTGGAEISNPNPLILYAVETDGEKDIRELFDQAFGIPTRSCIAIERLIYNAGSMRV